MWNKEIFTFFEWLITCAAMSINAFAIGMYCTGRYIPTINYTELKIWLIAAFILLFVGIILMVYRVRKINKTKGS